MEDKNNGPNIEIDGENKINNEVIDERVNNKFFKGDKIKNYLVLPLIGLSALFLLIVINQSLQLIKLAGSFHIILAWLVAILIMAIFAIFIIYPLYKLLSIKELPDIPKVEGSKEYDDYIDTMYELMHRNSFVLKSGFTFTGNKKEDLIKIFSLLDEEADKFVYKEAQEVFLTTAISQNGSLDSIFVLKSLFTLVWKIIHMYEGRPSIKKIAYIYTNVAATVLVARGLEDLDLIEDQVEPLVASLVGGSVMSVIPGAVPITNLIVSSVMQGSINALLVLRCGCITQRYMASLTEPNKKILRRSASLEAVGKIGLIIKENTLPIVKAFAKAAKSAATSIQIPKFKIKYPWVKDN